MVQIGLSSDMKTCNICKVTLVVNENWNLSFQRKNYYICKECRKKYSKNYRDNNKNKLKEKYTIYYKENTDNILEYQKNYYEKNKELKKQYSIDYYKKYKNSIKNKNKTYREMNKERIIKQKNKWRLNNLCIKRSSNARYRAYKGKASIGNYKKEINNIYKKCRELEKMTNIKYHVDHIIPLNGKTVCGLHVPWNLQIIKAEDNLKKGNKITKNYNIVVTSE